ncbi:MAG TPA: nucleotidyl transferase AbiEii/AbiGii toxin family protein [Verrucomicrobiae bacterium]|nr:nucleotidyl transferase AbiEii/AbiGii toxin family protein [Verrucomicrobiae bacterium]
MMDKAYIETVRLLLECAPAIFETPHFAMKGGTAINLFIEDMPRLSVDIDVVYTDHQASRDESLKSISKGLDATRKRLTKAGLESEVSATKDGDEIKLFIRRGRNQVKVEVNHVFRGTVLPVETRQLGDEARKLFTTELSAPILAAPELYGSKLVAAMDRQHPRDLFDVRGLFERGGLTREIVECFVCYLAGHNRPVHEVLFSRDQDMSSAFENEFVGMTRNPIKLAELEAVRRRLKRELPAALTESQREFLLGLVAGEPNWQLMKCPHLSQLPAIRWKLQNLAKLKKSNPRKFSQQAEELRARLAG